jgi:hypothetical protein
MAVDLPTAETVREGRNQIASSALGLLPVRFGWMVLSLQATFFLRPDIQICAAISFFLWVSAVNNQKQQSTGMDTAWG